MLSNFAAWQLAKAQLVAKEAIFKEQNADLIAEEKEFRESYSEQEEELRLLIVEVYNATGNRIPSEHLGIRMNKYILYDKADAMQFGRETGIGISLNTREFEKYAKDNPAEVTFAVMEEAPSATISKALYA